MNDNFEELISNLSVIVAAILFYAFQALLSMWLWNSCLIAVFPSIPSITYLQMLGILILCRCLFIRPTFPSNDED
jgi:presenilin-like A22 family membrane protease